MVEMLVMVVTVSMMATYSHSRHCLLLPIVHLSNFSVLRIEIKLSDGIQLRNSYPILDAACFKQSFPFLLAPLLLCLVTSSVSFNNSSFCDHATFVVRKILVSKGIGNRVLLLLQISHLFYNFFFFKVYIFAAANVFHLNLFCSDSFLPSDNAAHLAVVTITIVMRMTKILSCITTPSFHHTLSIPPTPLWGARGLREMSDPRRFSTPFNS